MKKLGLNPLPCSETIILMNGTESQSILSCKFKASVCGKETVFDCLVSDLLCDYDMLLGMDKICSLGGIIIDKSGEIKFPELSCTVPTPENLCALSFEKTIIKDKDFEASFNGKFWTAKWNWKVNEEPSLENKVSQYSIKAAAKQKFEDEVQDWIRDGWLKKFEGKPKGIIPLMAVIQPNKDKVRPVMDYRELNCFVSSHTAESDVCGEKLKKWRKMGHNLHIIDLKKAYLQVRIHEDLQPYQVVKFNNQFYCLTRLGFGLNCAPKIMTSILKKVFEMDKRLERAVDSYIDDIIVDGDKIDPKEVADHLKRYGLLAKEPESLKNARVLGLKVYEKKGELLWNRDNVLRSFTDIETKRQLFSLCGQLVGHFPVASWLRPACSFIKRKTNDLKWDEKFGNGVKNLLIDIEKRLESADPVRGSWRVDASHNVEVWCDASSIAIGTVLVVDNKVIEDGCWLRKQNDPLHINTAELESVIKGVNCAISWGFSNISIFTDSSSVSSWLRSIIDKDKKMHVSSLSCMLIRRRIQLIGELISELGLKIKVTLVPSHQNRADELTRVPKSWISNQTGIAAACLNKNEIIKSVHEIHHFGVDKTLYFCGKMHPSHNISKENVADIIKACNKCATIDPNPTHVETGELSVKEVWDRLASDVTHYNGKKYLTTIDCGPSRFAIWKQIKNESAQEIAESIESIFRQFGPPKELLLDNYTTFKSSRFLEMCKKWRVQPIYRCAYRPSGNGIIERHHRTIKRMAARAERDILDMTYWYNIAPKVKLVDSTCPYNVVFNHKSRCFHPSDNFPTLTNQSFSFSHNLPFRVGDIVYVKPHPNLCTSTWRAGTVTNVNSSWSVSVDGIPYHVRDIRTSNQQQPSKPAHVDVSFPPTHNNSALPSRPQRTRRPPVRFNDYVLQ